MSKLSQLQALQQWGMPVPAFRAVTYEDVLAGRLPTQIRFPAAVRSSYRTEDGSASSQAGQFETRLGVDQPDLPEALEAVFRSYPDPSHTSAIVQEMVEPDYSGVLFAFRTGVWKLELTAGRGDRLMSGQAEGHMLLLPRFGKADAQLAPALPFWSGPSFGGRALTAALVRLSYLAGRLLRKMDAEHGLDIEFCMARGQLWLLQARPITTPGEAEEVLTSANHKEILPPKPSRLMTDLITRCGHRLFRYYQDLDPSLPSRSFLRAASGMPWINLSALLDTMVHWGLPTALVCRSVGAEDFYQVGLRPWRSLARLGVFTRVLGQQLSARKRIQAWQKKVEWETQSGRAHRERLWPQQPKAAFEHWCAGFSNLYVELVTNMQILTGAMSGPVGLAERLGLLPQLASALNAQSASTDYLQAFREWERGQLSQSDFLEQFGHRGFYESDLGQPRFWEYRPADWAQLKAGTAFEDAPPPAKKQSSGTIWARLFWPVLRLIHTREWIRHETMKCFWSYREELQQQIPFPPWPYRMEELNAYFAGGAEPTTTSYPPQSGWDMDTFLANQLGRRWPIANLENVAATAGRQGNRGIGIYPGKVKGQVWRVASASLKGLTPPPYPVIILVADALDPGWVPYFSKVDAVASYVGGVLSHASIMLREARVPSITQLPGHIALRTGDWVEIDGQEGTLRPLGQED